MLRTTNAVREEEMRVRIRDVKNWMSQRVLPKNLRDRITRYEQYKWRQTRGVDEENLIGNLPKDLQKDVKRHLFRDILLRMPIFAYMDEHLIDAMCHRVKPVLYPANSSIVHAGDPVEEMLFIMRGTLNVMTTEGVTTGSNNKYLLQGYDFCGEELFPWALHPRPPQLPISTRTIETVTDVEAFFLLPDDIIFLASRFRTLHGNQNAAHIFRFYSQKWRMWAVCFIQAAWRRHCKRKAQREGEKNLQVALAKGGGSSLSFGAAIYASRFAANIVKSTHNSDIKQNKTV